VQLDGTGCAKANPPTGRDVLLVLKKQVNLDAGKCSFCNRLCDDWNKLPGWVVSGGSVNEFKGNLDHYLRDNRGFKKVMITLSPLEPSVLSSMLLAAILGKFSKLV